MSKQREQRRENFAENGQLFNIALQSRKQRTGSVSKVLQKEEGHGSHWGVFMNPVKRKAEP
jgi:hypothetical protein